MVVRELMVVVFFGLVAVMVMALRLATVEMVARTAVGADVGNSGEGGDDSDTVVMVVVASASVVAGVGHGDGGDGSEMVVMALMCLVLVVVMMFTVTVSVVVGATPPWQVMKLSFSEEPGLSRSIFTLLQTTCSSWKHGTNPESPLSTLSR